MRTNWRASSGAYAACGPIRHPLAGQEWDAALLVHHQLSRRVARRGSVAG
jgi:hypothetical protein